MGDLYKQNQAFNNAFERCHNINTDHNSEEWHDRHYNYSSSPEKLKKFPPMAIYNIWLDELYATSQTFIKYLTKINTDMANSSTNWLGFFKKKKKINSYFNELYIIDTDLTNFKRDCFEYQRCILATDLLGNVDDADILQEQLRYIDLIESRIIQTGDRKLASINNSRIQVFGLILSITAITVSVISLLYSK